MSNGMHHLFLNQGKNKSSSHCAIIPGSSGNILWVIPLEAAWLYACSPTHLLLGPAIMNLSSHSSIGSQVWREGDENWHEKVHPRCNCTIGIHLTPRPGHLKVKQKKQV